MNSVTKHQEAPSVVLASRKTLRTSRKVSFEKVLGPQPTLLHNLMKATPEGAQALLEEQESLLNLAEKSLRRVSGRKKL